MRKALAVINNNKEDDMYSPGKVGELIIQNFVDSNFTKILSFPNPNNKRNEEICDILIWHNYTVYLCEIKTRADNNANYSWIKSKIIQSVDQLTRSYKRIKSNDEIFLVNSKHNIPLDCQNIHQIIGIIILVYDNEIDVKPSEVCPEIYQNDFPIHTFSHSLFFKLKDEIKSLMDLNYYLNDRYLFIKKFDLSLTNEVNALGYYKNNKYNFPQKDINFANHWDLYTKSKRFDIFQRNLNEKYINWIEHIENLLLSEHNIGDSKRFDNIPLGLFLSWEFSALDFAIRISIGEKLSNIHKWFSDGNTSRKFSINNPLTENIILFYFSTDDTLKINKDFMNLTRLKYVQAKTDDDFSQGIYAIAFYYNKDLKKSSVEMFLIMGDKDFGEVTDEEYTESKKYWGDKTKIEVNEYKNYS